MNAPPTAAPNLPAATAPQTRLPLRGWALELARRWNGGTYSLFVLHGNIYDLFPVQDNGDLHYVPLKTFLVRRFFPERACLLFYDISDGLTFGSSEMQKRFFEWLGVYDSVENTNFHEAGPPRDFVRLAPLLRRFFLRVADEQEKWRGITLVIDYPEKLIPACEEASVPFRPWHLTHVNPAIGAGSGDMPKLTLFETRWAGVVLSPASAFLLSQYSPGAPPPPPDTPTPRFLPRRTSSSSMPCGLFHESQFTPVGFSRDPPFGLMSLSHRRAASWSRPRIAWE